MPPKVDPTEVRYSTIWVMQSTLKFSEESLDPLPLLPLNLVLSVWYGIDDSER